MDADKVERIHAQIDRAKRYLANNPHYVMTCKGENPLWQGKIRCRYCKVAGYACEPNGDVAWDWWTQRHGEFCKKKDYWLFKNGYQNQNIITYTSGANFSPASFTASSAKATVYLNGNGFFTATRI